MLKVYINNFRGFKDTIVPIKHVNFLVGENSTGKTSILKLLKIISDDKFWWTFNFSLEESDLGYFSELLSKSTDQKHFEIAIAHKDTNDNKFNYFYLRFINDDGLPKVNLFRILNDYYHLRISIKSKEVRYSYEMSKNEELHNDIIETNFKKWVKNDSLAGSNYSRELIEEDYPIRFVLISVISNVYKNLSDNISKNEKDDLFSFPFNAPPFLNSITSIAPIRDKPRRTYDNYKIKFSPEGFHSPFLLKSMLTRKRKTGHSKEFKNKLIQFGKESGLFDDIVVKDLGKDKTSPFEIQLKLNNSYYKIPNVGYGVSQILPLIVEIIARTERTLFSFQQPEIHLHPKAQASFGEAVFNMAKDDDKSFIIETHSDYIIDRYRLCIYKSSNSMGRKILSSQVLFFERTPTGNRLTPIKIEENGKYALDQPKAFKEFFIKEQLELIKI